MEIHISASEGSIEQQQMLYCNTDFSKALSDQPRISNSCCFLCSAAVYHPAQSWQPHGASELKQSGIPVESFIALRRAVGKAQSSPTALRLGWGRTYRESLWKSLGGGLRRGPRATTAWIEDGTRCRGYEGRVAVHPQEPWLQEHTEESPRWRQGAEDWRWQRYTGAVTVLAAATSGYAVPLYNSVLH